MKKFTMLSLLLIGFGMSAKLFAQQDLQVNNGTACYVAVSYYYVDPCSGCPGTKGTYTVPPSTNITISTGAACGSYVDDVTVIYGSTVDVYDGCAGIQLTGSGADCNSIGRNVTFTPAVLTPGSAANAIVDIN